jgi:hypothetical protein
MPPCVILLLRFELLYAALATAFRSKVMKRNTLLSAFFILLILPAGATALQEQGDEAITAGTFRGLATPGRKIPHRAPI